MREKFTFEQMREKALKENVPDNKIAIGIWIRLMGFKKRRLMINYKRKLYYYYDKE